jgi:DNA-binding transcriptional ArsR family regulator
VSVAAQLEADPVDARVVKALGHPTRVRILNVLHGRELASPVELSAELGVALGTVGYHVKRLEQLGFIELARRTQRRGAVEHHYRARQVLDASPAGADDQALGAPASEGRGAQAVAIARAAQAALGCGGFDAVPAHADWRTLTLDADADAEWERLLARWQASVERIARASERRRERTGEPPSHSCVAVVMAFPQPAGGDAG